MSYDYMLIRVKKPVQSLSEIDEDIVLEYSQWGSVKKAIETVIPDIIWEEFEGSMWGRTHSVEGRFEILISGNVLEKNKEYFRYSAHIVLIKQKLSNEFLKLPILPLSICRKTNWLMYKLISPNKAVEFAPALASAGQAKDTPLTANVREYE